MSVSWTSSQTVVINCAKFFIRVLVSYFQFNNSSLISALVEGVENNDVATVDRILQYDAVCRKNFNVNGSLHDSLLHKAVRNNNYEIWKMLVKFGADVNLLNLDNQSPLNVTEETVNFLYV